LIILCDRGDRALIPVVKDLPQQTRL
jgi:hypothetical protein